MIPLGCLECQNFVVFAFSFSVAHRHWALVGFVVSVPEIPRSLPLKPGCIKEGVMMSSLGMGRAVTGLPEGRMVPAASGTQELPRLPSAAWVLLLLWASLRMFLGFSDLITSVLNNSGFSRNMSSRVFPLSRRVKFNWSEKNFSWGKGVFVDITRAESSWQVCYL